MVVGHIARGKLLRSEEERARGVNGEWRLAMVARAAVKYINYIRAAAINGFRAGEKYDPKREVT